MFTIVEDFYADPDSVRDYALSQNFNVSGNYPGLRTASCSNDGGYADSMQSREDHRKNHNPFSVRWV